MMNMRSLDTTLLAVVAWLAASPALMAENTEISPYSRFGYGALSSHANATQKAMGGVGLALRDSRSVNFMNPASYAAIDSLTFLFDMGVQLKGLSTNETRDGVKLSGKDFTGGLDYVTMEFPVTRYGAAAVGLVPWSQVGYSFGNDIVNGSNSNQGSGNVSELFVGLSARPFKGFTLGVNVSYMFGTLLNDMYVYGDGVTSLFERVTEVRDYSLRFGVQYGLDITRDHNVAVGLIYSPKKSFHGHAYGVKYDVNQDNSADTIGYASMKGAYEQAATYGAGLAWIWKKSLTVAADFTYQPWKNVKYRLIEGFDQPGANRFDNYWKAGVGVQYQPAARGSYLRRVNYRLGGYYSNDYVMVGSNSIREYGLSVGLGLPAPSSKTMVNLSFEYRHRAASPQKLVVENYWQLTLGFNINELWFWQNKLR